MSFIDDVRNFIDGKQTELDGIKNEEQTKTSLIMPFFHLLGYNVFNVNEFKPEYEACIGDKNNEKVDYAIIRDGKPIIIIEAKPYGKDLVKYDKQLERYFAFTSAKFAVLTNGITYRFFTDLDAPNLMDKDPFFVIDLMDCTDVQIKELHRFHSDNFEELEIMNAAEELKYLSKMKDIFKQIFTDPSDDFVRFILDQGIYSEKKTSKAVERFRPVVKRSLTSYINDLVNSRIQSAITKEEDNQKPDPAPSPDDSNQESAEVKEDLPKKQIITTQEELECFYAICAILRNEIDVNRLSYKDTQSYFGVLVDNKVTRWIAHIYIKDRKKYFTVPGKDGEKDQRIDIEGPNDLYNYSALLIEKLHQVM